MKSKIVYTVFATEQLHYANIEFLQRASRLGELVVGVYSNDVLKELGRVVLSTQDERIRMISEVKGVTKVVRQDSLFYDDNLRILKPDFVAHGENWRRGRLEKVRERVISLLSEWNGEIVEFPYTHGVTSDKIYLNISQSRFLPEIRRGRLKALFNGNSIVRIIEAHNGLTGLIAEHATAMRGDAPCSFDGIWVSSLCDSTAKGKPDIELVDFSSRLHTIQEIMEVTTKPIILDGDSGGLTEHFVYNLRSAERAGVSAVIIEDKIGLKQNSLFEKPEQSQDSIKNFCQKISAGKNALSSDDFFLIARIESLILGAGMDDALARAKAYIAAGADAIMIHSNHKNPDEVYEFCKKYHNFASAPIVVVPTTYNSVTEQELQERGVKMVIYANHLIRSAYPAMMNTAQTILESGRSLEADSLCMPIKEILELIPK